MMRKIHVLALLAVIVFCFFWNFFVAGPRDDWTSIILLAFLTLICTKHLSTLSGRK